MRILYNVAVVVLLLSGCAGLMPNVDVCASYPTTTERSYCYASNEVTAARNATMRSLKDGAITVDQAKKAAKVLSDADAVLDNVEMLIAAGDMSQADVQLSAARTILLELKR